MADYVIYSRPISFVLTLYRVLNRDTTSPIFVDAETYNVNISFPDVNYVWLESQNSLPLFKEKVKSAVAHEVSISEQRMSMVRVYRVPWVVVGFTLLPSLYAEDGESRVRQGCHFLYFCRISNFLRKMEFLLRIIYIFFFMATPQML